MFLHVSIWVLPQEKCWDYRSTREEGLGEVTTRVRLAETKAEADE